MIGIGKNLFKGNVKAGGGAPTYDADAQAYFTANTAITSAADKNAINTFYLGLKSDGIYTKIQAMYLPIWSSATNNKWNLVNPLDTNAAFRLTFSTGWSFNSSGMLCNGASYANTNFNLAAYSSTNHLAIYSQTNIDDGTNDCGVGSTGNVYVFAIGLRNSNLIYFQNHETNSFLSATNTDSKGFYINLRNNTSFKGFKNGSQIASKTSAGPTSINLNMWIGCRNVNNVGTFYANKRYSFSCMGTGLTDTEASNLSSRVNTLMTYFGINTY